MVILLFIGIHYQNLTPHHWADPRLRYCHHHHPPQPHHSLPSYYTQPSAAALSARYSSDPPDPSVSALPCSVSWDRSRHPTKSRPEVIPDPTPSIQLIHIPYRLV